MTEAQSSRPSQAFNRPCWTRRVHLLTLLAGTVLLGACEDDGPRKPVTAPLPSLAPNSKAFTWRYVHPTPSKIGQNTYFARRLIVTRTGVFLLEDKEERLDKRKNIKYTLSRFADYGKLAGQVALIDENVASGISKYPRLIRKSPDDNLHFVITQYEFGGQAFINSYSYQSVSATALKPVANKPMFSSKEGYTGFIFAGANTVLAYQGGISGTRGRYRLRIAKINLKSGRRDWEKYFLRSPLRAGKEALKKKHHIEAVGKTSATVTPDGGLQFISGGLYLREGGFSHIVHRLTVDADGEPKDWKSLLGSSHKGRTVEVQGIRLPYVYSPQVYGVLPHPAGGHVITLYGWHNGKYARVRLVRLDADGKELWTNALVPGNEGAPQSVAIGKDGDIFVAARTVNDLSAGAKFLDQIVFRLGADGKVKARFMVKNMYIDHVHAHPAGGFVLQVTTKNEKGDDRMNVLRLKTWPAVPVK